MSLCTNCVLYMKKRPFCFQIQPNFLPILPPTNPIFITTLHQYCHPLFFSPFCCPFLLPFLHFIIFLQKVIKYGGATSPICISIPLFLPTKPNYNQLLNITTITQIPHLFPYVQQNTIPNMKQRIYPPQTRDTSTNFFSSS
ncbi:conserved hypothetical protein [Ricinus communis]|uniref:Uncharacterized protein n=1 Tax=Ricinus communis TaxID=3988 RepID=B9RBU7_RICCO|nr:conserved hypothetical protein [Ricinus communis]